MSIVKQARELIPQNFIPEQHQLDQMMDEARFKVIVWHRKAHKTTLCVAELLRMASVIPGTYWYVAPFLSQARKVVWEDPEMLQKYCPPSIWERRNNSGLYLTFPNGSKLYILGADNPDSLRGPNPKFVVLDEYDDMKPSVWSAIIQPIMMANPLGRTWFVGTYKGRKDLFNKYMYAKQEMEANGMASQWSASLLKASVSGIIAPADLEEARKTTTEAFFKQEYECEPLDNASAVFRNIDACTLVVNPQNGLIVPWTGVGEPKPGHKYAIGVDLAKFNDFTVITPFNLTNFRVYKQDRFNQIEWNLQKAKVELAYLRHSKGEAKAITRIDSTGAGEPIYEDLSKRIPGLEPINFAGGRRDDMLQNLALLIEQGKITIPNDEILLNELRSFQYVLKESKGGRMRIAMEIPEGVHDDTVMSLALAVYNKPEEPIKDLSELRQQREDLKQFDAHRNRHSSTGSAYLRRRIN